MNERIKFLLRKALLLWGALSLVAVLGAGAFIVFKAGAGNSAEIDAASHRDVRFVLNGCGLGEHRIDKVVRSYVSSRSLTGDHLDAYAIKITHVDAPELMRATDSGVKWYRGDQLPQVVNDAVEFAGAWLGGAEIPWFPAVAQLRSADVYIYPQTIHIHGVTPTATALIFVRTSDKMVFYVSSKT